MIETATRRHRTKGCLPDEASETQFPFEWWLDRSVAQTLYRLLQQIDPPGDEWEQEIDRLGAVHGRGVVCAELIFLLTRLKLEPAAALGYWPTVLRYRLRMTDLLGHPIDLRVSLMSFFLDVERQLDRPTVVEMDWIERATAFAYIDEVTGLPNHRFFRDQLRREMDRSLRDNTPMSLVLVDADNFKAVNDVFGHEVGNEVLVSLGDLFRRKLHVGHVVARYGGEEFVIVMPNTPKVEAAALAETLRHAVVAHRFPVKDALAPLALTISLGLATCPADAHDEADLIVAADRALHEAKTAGKNQVCLYGASTRSYARRSVARAGTVRPVELAECPVQTVQIGEGGLSFRTACYLAVGTLLEVAIALRADDKVQLAGRVVWTSSVETGGYESAIQFIEQAHAGRQQLVRWLGSQPLSPHPAAGTVR